MSFFYKAYKQFSIDSLSHKYLKEHIHEYIELKEDDIKQLQKCLLGMLKDINDMCAEFGIDYALTGGNVLGKIRHNGFIPWDDDIDLVMMRNDYEKFKEAFGKSNLSTNYILTGPGCNDGADYRCMKIYKKDSVMERIFQKNNTQHKIFVDIMPFDYVPDSKVHRKMKNLWCSFLIAVLGCVDFKLNFCTEIKAEMRKTTLGLINYFLRLCAGTIFGVIPLQTWYNWYDRAPVYSKQTSYGTVYNGKLLYLDEIVPVDYYHPFQNCDYCGVITRIIHQPEKYLEFRYGDYMKIPDRSNRETHIVKKIDVGGVKE